MDVLLNMVFLHALSPTAINNVVPGGWSIGVEMLFYMIAPLLFFLAMDRVRLFVATIVMLGMSLAVMSMSECNGTLDWMSPTTRSAISGRRCKDRASSSACGRGMHFARICSARPT